MMSSRGPSKSEAADLISPRQEGLGASDDASKTVVSSVSRASLASTPWFRLKDPRVVRVSRAFSGKDRHSKVFTIKGLRDRRVRLSVPTAIQLYDLQDRLGLSQPSKVVDWLLDAAKHEIDELPPLPLQPIHLGHPQFFHQYSSSPSNISTSAGTNQNRSSNKEIEMIDGISLDGGNSLCNSSTGHKFLHSLESSFQNKADGDCEDEEDQERIMRSDQEEVSEGIRDRIAEGLLWRGNFSSRTNHGYNMPYGSNVSHLEPSNIASFPRHRQITSQASLENPQSLNIHRHIPSALSISHAHPYFPVQFITSTRSDMDPRQVSHLQPTFMTNSDLQNFLPSFHELPLNSQSHHQPSSVGFPSMSFDVNTTAAPSQSSSENDMEKDQHRSQHSPLIKH